MKAHRMSPKVIFILASILLSVPLSGNAALILTLSGTPSPPVEDAFNLKIENVSSPTITIDADNGNAFAQLLGLVEDATGDIALMTTTTNFNAPSFMSPTNIGGWGVSTDAINGTQGRINEGEGLGFTFDLSGLNLNPGRVLRLVSFEIFNRTVDDPSSFNPNLIVDGVSNELGGGGIYDVSVDLSDGLQVVWGLNSGDPYRLRSLTLDVVAVPTPGTISLFSLALLGIGWVRRKGT